jgi:hypothetical protein
MWRTGLPLLLRFLLLTMESSLELALVPKSLASWFLAVLLLLLRLLCLGLMLVSSLLVIRIFSSMLKLDNFANLPKSYGGFLLPSSGFVLCLVFTCGFVHLEACQRFLFIKGLARESVLILGFAREFVLFLGLAR